VNQQNGQNPRGVGPQQGGMVQQPLYNPLMPLGVGGQPRGGLPLQPQQQQPGLLPQQQQQRGPQQQLGQPQQRQRGPGPQPPLNQQPAPQSQQQQRNGVGVATNGIPPQQLLNKNLPPHLLAQQAANSNQQNIRYADNVRNRAPQQTTPGAPTMNGANAPDAVVMPLPSEPLTIKALAQAPEDMRKQMIGERLFPSIKMQEPALAGKITGMLLEMDNGELIHLLESHQALSEKINEALQVLQQHPDITEGETGAEDK